MVYSLKDYRIINEKRFRYSKIERDKETKYNFRSKNG